MPHDEATASPGRSSEVDAIAYAAAKEAHAKGKCSTVGNPNHDANQNPAGNPPEGQQS